MARLGCAVYQRLRARGNLVFSPLGVWSVLDALRPGVWPATQHDALAIGYDDARKALRTQSSLRPAYFRMPYGFVACPGSTTDFHVITALAGSS
jgi:hypothetical protein